MATSIFDIERRVSIRNEFSKILILLDNEVIYKQDSYTQYYRIYNLLNLNFLDWKYRGSSIDIDSYLTDLSIDPKSLRSLTYSDTSPNYLYFFELILNLIPLCLDVSLGELKNNKENKTSINAVIDNILYALETQNYRSIHLDDGTDRIAIVKRDANVDAVIDNVNNDRVKLDLLSYLDFRNENDILAKGAIIARLYKYTEDESNGLFIDARVLKESNSKQIKPYNDFRFICQHFDIRHDPKRIKEENGNFIKIPELEVIELCDIAFRMFLQICTVPEIVEDNNTLERYKEHYNLD